MSKAPLDGFYFYDILKIPQFSPILGEIPKNSCDILKKAYLSSAPGKKKETGTSNMPAILINS